MPVAENTNRADSAETLGHWAAGHYARCIRAPVRGQKPRFLPAADRSGALIPLKAPQATLLGPSWASALRARRALTRSASKIAPGDFVSQSIELLCLEPIVAHELQQAALAHQV